MLRRVFLLILLIPKCLLQPSPQKTAMPKAVNSMVTQLRQMRLSSARKPVGLKWTIYTDSLVASKILQPPLSGLIELYHRLVLNLPCLNNHQLQGHSHQVYRNGDFKAPCSSFMFSSLVPTTKVWTITVHSMFMINITIEKAFVPYTDGCKSDNYVLVNSWHGSRFCPACGFYIAHFCGHVHMESVYSRRNTASIKIQADIQIAQHPTSIKLVYAVAKLGSAFISSVDNHYSSSLTENIRANIAPRHIIFTKTFLHYIWYFNNDIGYVNAERPQFIYHSINISYSSCGTPWTEISVYPGILSLYMMQWQIVPVTRVGCNIIGTTTINTDFHMYATLCAKVSHLDTHVNFAIHISHNHPTLGVSFPHPSPPVELYHYRKNFYRFENKPAHYLQFTSVVYDGDLSTARPDIFTANLAANLQHGKYYVIHSKT